MNELAIFAGIGCGLLATTSLGFEPICAIENDGHAASVLVQRQNEGIFRPFPIWDDVRTFNGRPFFQHVDLVSAGFPCQAFSTAAHGRNVADNLWPEALRVIREVGPNYVFGENVSAKAIERAGSDLAALGYKAEMLSLSAADLGGDHRRERFWLLAYSDDKSKLRGQIDAKMAELPELCGGVWSSDPGKPRMAHGSSSRLERYRAIGNGQVPVVAAAAFITLARD